jgi:hypothetical protein
MPVVVLPAFTAVFGESVKFTVLPLFTVTVRDSERVAFRVTVPVLELIWALADGTFAAMRNKAAVRIHNFLDDCILMISLKRQQNVALP